MLVVGGEDPPVFYNTDNLQVAYKMMQNENELSTNEGVCHINLITHEIQKSSVPPLRKFGVAHKMDDSRLCGCPFDDIHFDRPKSVEWLKKVFQRHINDLGSDLL